MNFRIPGPVLVAISVLLLFSMLAMFALGIVVQRFRIFPYPLITDIERAIVWSLEKASGDPAWYYREGAGAEPILWQSGAEQGPLNLVTAMAEDDQIVVRLIDMAGTIRNEWKVDWFKIWPDATHLTPGERPQSPRGTHIKGIVMLPDGDIVFNFEHLGLVRMKPCGEVVWKLPYRTHHSVFLDETGMLWVSAQITRFEPLDGYPNHIPPFQEPMVLQVSPDGEILREISVFEVLDRNKLRALLHLGTIANRKTVISGDILHLNDVEVFPSGMEEGVFRHGDIMISLRNISTVLVFDPDTLKIRYRQTGGFVRQHDPDFIDGNTISVFDNNHIGPPDYGQQSRILVISAPIRQTRVWYEGTEDEPFYTDLMGKSQWLDDGNLLITDSRSGRGFEVNGEGKIVWQYINQVGGNLVGMAEEVQRLPLQFTPMFAASQAERCGR